jgi:hypothetical protein
VSIEASSWVDLVAGDSTRDLPFVARGPDGRIVAELRGTVTVSNGSIVAAEGTTVRPRRSGATFVTVDVGDKEVSIPIAVYQPVTSFVGAKVTTGDLMAMRVSLARGDTMEVPLPKSAFWVTYLPKDRGAAPPTIELRGDGSCTTGNGIRQRRIEDDEYAKYCPTGNGARLMIAHGANGAASVRTVEAMLIALIVADWRAGERRLAYPLSLAFCAVIHALIVPVSSSGPWRAAMAWLDSMPM